MNNRPQNKNIYEYSLKRQFIGRIGDDSVHYQIKNPESVADYLKSIDFHADEQENMVVLFLDVRNQIKGYQMVTRGLADRSHVHPREIFRSAIIAGSAKIILAHNHPSGDTSPSSQDKVATQNLIDAGKILSVKVIDHIVVGEKAGVFNFTSLRSSSDIDWK